MKCYPVSSLAYVYDLVVSTTVRETLTGYRLTCTPPSSGRIVITGASMDASQLDVPVHYDGVLSLNTSAIATLLGDSAAAGTTVSTILEVQLGSTDFYTIFGPVSVRKDVIPNSPSDTPEEYIVTGTPGTPAYISYAYASDGAGTGFVIGGSTVGALTGKHWLGISTSSNAPITVAQGASTDPIWSAYQWTELPVGATGVAGSVTAVNGVAPDTDGNVTLPAVTAGSIGAATTAALAAEAAARAAADTAEAATRAAADTANSSSITAETARASAAEAGKLDAALVGADDGVCPLDSTGHIPTAYIPVTSVTSAVMSALTTEVTAREAGDTSLASAIAAEQARAEAAEAAAITTAEAAAEAAAATAAATAIAAAIATEVTNRNSAIATETTRAEAAEAAAITSAVATSEAYTDAAVAGVTAGGLGAVPTSRTVNGHALTGNITVTKGDVGLGNCDNTSDANKPVSTAQAAAIAAVTVTSLGAQAANTQLGDIAGLGAPADGDSLWGSGGHWIKKTVAQVKTLLGLGTAAFLDAAGVGSNATTTQLVRGDDTRLNIANGSLVEYLSANRTYYVGPSGSDANDGLTSGTALATVQAALNKLSKIHLNGYSYRVRILAGTYTAQAISSVAPVGYGAIALGQIATGGIFIQGDSGTASDVVLQGSGGSGAAVVTINHDFYRLLDVSLRQTDTATDLVQAVNGIEFRFSNLRFGQSGMWIRVTFATAYSSGNCAVYENGAYGFYVSYGSLLYWNHQMALGTRTLSAIFMSALSQSNIWAGGSSFTGTLTGKRYLASGNGIINTNAGGSTFFPGSIAGTVDTQGQYV